MTMEFVRNDHKNKTMYKRIQNKHALLPIRCFFQLMTSQDGRATLKDIAKYKQMAADSIKLA